MKRLIFLVLMITVLVLPSMFVFAGGAKESGSAGGKVAVGVVLPTKDVPRWIQDETRFNDAFKKGGYDVQILFSQGDSAKEKANVEALISKGIKVLIICPQDASAAAAAADEAHATGVKVISYDRLIRDTASVDYYVTFDSVAVGAAWGDYLVSKATGKGNNLYLYAGAASDNNAFLFFQGAWSKLQPKIADGTFVIKNSSEAVALQGKATLSRDEEARIIGQVTTNWTANDSKNLAEANLTAASAADKGTVYILAPNDNTARAIADAFAADKDVTKYYISGQDAEIASIQYIIDGKCAMTVMGDWAEGYFKARGQRPDRDFGWAPSPGTAGSFIMLSDSFGLPRGAPDRQAAVDWLTLAASREGQDAFNPKKGSIPSRTDCDRSLYDVYQRSAMDSYQSEAIIPSVTHGAAAAEGWLAGIQDVISTFLCDANVDAAVASLAKIASSYVRPQPQRRQISGLHSPGP